MPSVLALVSKAVFDKQAPRSLTIGGVWAVDRYDSKVAGLRPLADGGSLFLVTVRPPDERLWLVAVLEEPSFRNARWKAAPNATPVTDVTPLVGELRFATDKGLAAAPGKLGMSLQTPRTLSEADVELLPKALSGGAAPKRAGRKGTAVAPTPTRKPAPTEALGRALAPLGSDGEPVVPGGDVRVFYLPQFRLWLSPGFQALVTHLDTAPRNIAEYVVNPAVSAPAAVEAARAKHDLDEDAAALHLQIRWLPEPTRARVTRCNHWTAERYDRAAAALVAKGLVVEAGPQGTSQQHFLPGPLVHFERYPGPVEAPKLAHLALTEGKVPPLDVPLLVSPVEELYARE
jgi:hypothetical protein